MDWMFSIWEWATAGEGAERIAKVAAVIATVGGVAGAAVIIWNMTIGFWLRQRAEAKRAAAEEERDRRAAEERARLEEKLAAT